MRLLDGKLPAQISAPRSDGQVTLALDRARVNNYLASVTPLLLTGQLDAIGFLGMAASCCGDDPDLADVRDLILAAEGGWLDLVESSPEGRRLETRRLFRVVGLAQAMALYG
jgi:hypothetical protein